ncbi:hypothetical protein [Amycolatopsis coloradensis]|uniref:hypothetical protein n=1 Tax=Amycolatopsis coloradensis TaxID=76021 RepID=UPI003CC90FC8
MAPNRSARRGGESLPQNVERHRELLTIIEGGDPEVVLKALADHGHGSFLDEVVDRLDGGTSDSERWPAERRSR